MFGGCYCGLGFRFVCSGLEVLSCWVGFCCCVTVGIHALHCWRLSCVGAIIIFAGLRQCLFSVPVDSMFFGLVTVVVGVGGGVVAVCSFVWVPHLCLWRLDGGSVYVGSVGPVVSGVV